MIIQISAACHYILTAEEIYYKAPESLGKPFQYIQQSTRHFLTRPQSRSMIHINIFILTTGFRLAHGEWANVFLEPWFKCP